MIGSSGCVADCIALQRQFRSEVSAYTYWTDETNHPFPTEANSLSMIPSPRSLTPHQVSVLLMNTLYHRRTFPFYAFCIVAGLNSRNEQQALNTNVEDTNDDHGAVYVYDAIGSNERVAVAAVGTGREMMQPILDRLFATSNLREIDTDMEKDPLKIDMERDGNAVSAKKQKQGNRLLPPVKTCVSYECEDAIDLLIRGYRSVAEREIGVGDDVVITALKRKMDGSHTLEVRRFALRKH